MDKKRKTVMIGFFVFLLLMGICTLVTKGIYTARLPQVTTTAPREMSLYHPVSVVGAVETGQEYGIYAPSGLRVASIAVQKGDSFQEGDALLQLDVEDLEHILAEKELEWQRQQLRQRETESQSAHSRQESAQNLNRALEDYERARRAGEVQTNRAGGELLRAQTELDNLRKELEQARKDLEQAQRNLERAQREKKEQEQREQEQMQQTQREQEQTQQTQWEQAQTQHQQAAGNPGQDRQAGNSAVTVSGGDNAVLPDISALSGQCVELEAAVKQLQSQISQQEQAVIAAFQAAEDSHLAYADGLQAAQRGVDDAQAAQEGSYQAAADLAKLEQAYLESEIQKLQELIDLDGWICAQENGRITQLCVGIGQRTPDTAQLLYTPDDGLRLLQARLTREQAGYVSEGTRMQMKFDSVSAGKQNREGVVSYIEPQEDGSILIQLDVTDQGMELGQQVTLESTWQSENYNLVIPLSALHQDGNGSYFVYILRQQNGILGVEWHAGVLYVDVADQNGRYAAIESASLSEESQIILTTFGELRDNAVVRIVE